jgi:hypothetical protein
VTPFLVTRKSNPSRNRRHGLAQLEEFISPLFPPSRCASRNPASNVWRRRIE